MTAKKTGMISGAHPTSPGGMSRKALGQELVTKHGWTVEEVKAQFSDINTWPKMIDTVIEERLLREHETSQAESRLLTDGVVMDQAGRYPEGDGDEQIPADILYGSLDEEPAPETQPIFVGLPGVRDYIFDGHAGTGPSGAERWMSCTMSLSTSRGFLETLTPNQQAAFAKSGSAARQGLTAHSAAEAEAQVVLGRLDSEELDSVLLELTIHPDSEGEAYNDEMAEYITEYVDLVQIYAQERGGENVLIEERVEATIPLMTVDSDGEQDVYVIPGSIDCGILPTEEHPTLVAADLKYGEGVDVDVDQNPQVRIYALGLLERISDPDTGQLPEWLIDVEYVIVQPRLGGIKTWTETVDDLLTWRDEVLSPALTEALGGAKSGAAFSPSDVACQWCPARGSCAALAQHRMEAAAELFDVIQETEFTEGPGAFPETGSMDNETLAGLYTQITGLVKMQAAMKEELNRRLHRGVNVPGYHLVNYQPPRKWKDDAEHDLDPGNRDHGLLTPEQAAKLWVEKLVTPTAAEKILGDEDYAKIMALVDKPDKLPVAAPVTDKRSAWVGKPPEQMFEVEES